MKRDYISAISCSERGKNTLCHFPLVLQAPKELNHLPFSKRDCGVFFAVEDYIIIIESHINLLQVGEGKC